MRTYIKDTYTWDRSDYRMKYSESMGNLTDIYLVQVYTIERCDHFSDTEYAQVKLNKSNKKNLKIKQLYNVFISYWHSGLPVLFFKKALQVKTFQKTRGKSPFSTLRSLQYLRNWFQIMCNKVVIAQGLSFAINKNMRYEAI